jgi:CRISPR-associated protein Csb2
VRFVWADADPDQATLAALDALAADTAYVGHSASLTRCRFVRTEQHDDGAAGQPPLRRVYAGRFAELAGAFAAGRRPSPGARVAPVREVGAPSRHSVFDSRWLLLDHVHGRMPDIRGAALVAKTIRDTLLDGYGSLGISRERIPEIVSGHMPDGAPTRAPHLAIVPLAFVGAPYADGRVLGFALVPPRGSGLLDDPEFLAVLRQKAPTFPLRDQRILTICTPRGTPRERAFRIHLSPTFRAERASLDPAPYLGPGRTFATVTPIVLDRHLKERGPARCAEMVEQIVAACRKLGLPDPAAIAVDGSTTPAVFPDKHSSFEGAVSAWPSGHAPAWTRWRLPASLASRSLVHAVIRFAEPVEGPVMLGAGRFVGLGLLRVLEEGTP